MYVQINKACVIIIAVILAAVFAAGVLTGKQLYDNRGSAVDAGVVIQDAQQSAAGAAADIDTAASAINDAQSTADAIGSVNKSAQDTAGGIGDGIDRLQGQVDADADAIRSGQQVLTDLRSGSQGDQ